MKQQTPHAALSEITGPTVPGKSPSEIAEFWTAERKRLAVPTPLPAIDKTKYQPGRAVGEPDQNYPVTFVPPHISSLPYAAVCKVFYVNNNQPYVASGWIVRGNTGVKGIITAGHVVYSRGTWSQSFLVQRAYTNGTFAEEWYSDFPRALRGWVETGDTYWDMAAILPTAAISDQTPSLETVYGLPYDQSPWNFFGGLGYPAVPANGYPFDGQLMWESDGPVLAAYKYRDGIVLQAADAMEHGSSGGPWVNYDKTSGVYYANGIQSSGEPGHRASYSPHFAVNNIVPLLVDIGVLRW